MSTISESKRECVLLFKVGTLIFSAVWGFNSAARVGGTGERPEPPSLYAACVSLFNRQKSMNYRIGNSSEAVGLLSMNPYFHPIQTDISINLKSIEARKVL
jgi:hypothetical protein